MPEENPIVSIKQRRRQNRDEIIEDIVQIARAMIRADGAASLSFNAIARELGIKPPSLYTYFESKHAIYDELFRRGWLLFLAEAEHYYQATGTVRDKLILLFESYMRFAQENPDYYQIMFQRPVPNFVPSEASLEISFNSVAQFTDYLKAILESEGLRPNIPYEEARDIILALNHGLTELHLANQPELPVGEGRFGALIHQAVDVLLKAWSVEK